MAKRDIIVSDFTGDEVGPHDLVTVTVRYADGRRGQVVADATAGDEVVRLIADAGRKQRRRGRRPAASLEQDLAPTAGRRAKARS